MRGSGLLLAGKLPTKVINLAVQVLTANYLTKGDFGALAYSLSIAALVQTVVTFGLNRAVTRYVPIYHERGEHGRIFGTLILVSVTVLSLSALAVATVYFGEAQLQRFVEPRTLALLAILIFLAPLQALDATLIALLAVFGAAKHILIRRHILAPLLNLAVILVVIALGLSVTGLAVGLLLSAVLGVGLYLDVLRRILREQGVLQHWDLGRIEVPAREVLTFTVPLLTTDLFTASVATMDVVMLGYFHDADLVADLRVIFPLALANQIVRNSFGVLFTPMAARLYGRGDHAGINALYWQVAASVAVFSLPVFLVTVALAVPVTVLMYGERYVGSGILLAVLSTAHYFNAAIGFNEVILKVYRRLRYIAAINLGAIALGFASNLLLIPSFGALGAAVATAGTLVVHNLLKHAGLRLRTGVDLLSPSYLTVYGWIVLAVGVTLLPQAFWDVPPAVTFLLAASVSLGVLHRVRHSLALAEMYPEIGRVPLIGRFLAG